VCRSHHLPRRTDLGGLAATGAAVGTHRIPSLLWTGNALLTASRGGS
jgi:hypothetical protein